MPSSFLRVALLSAAAMAATAAPAHAIELLGSPNGLNDATSDGRYVLAGTGVLDRTTGTTLPTGPGTPLALADRAPRVLVQTQDADLVVRDLIAGTEQIANISADGAPIELPDFGTHAELVENGQTVVFSSDDDPRVIERDLAAGTTTVRVVGASLLDASEDGEVVTFRKSLVPATRPAGSAALGEEPASVAGNAVGYQLRGQAARIVERYSATISYIGGFETGACSERRARISATSRPYDLQISQNGAGQYALYVSRAFATGSEIVQGGHTVIDRITADGTTLLIESANPSVQDRITADPVSGAYAAIHTTHGGSPIVNDATVVAQDGTSRQLSVLPVPGPGGSSDGLGFTAAALPIQAGAGAVYSATPRTADPFKGRRAVYVDESSTPGTSAGTPWLTLPRSVDGVDSASLRPDVTWPDCGPVVAPATIADYAALTLRTTGNSAGSVAVTVAPAGKAKAKSVTATVSWLGLPFSVRRVTTDTTIKLPGIPVGIGGFKLTLAAALDNGQTVRSGTTLRRTR